MSTFLSKPPNPNWTKRESHFEFVSAEGNLSKFRISDVEVDVRYARSSAERFALDEARDAVVLGTKLLAASPEALLWLYLHSKRLQNFVDGIGVIRSQSELELLRLSALVERDDPALAQRLDEIIAAARRPEISYEESRARRS